MYNIPNWNFGMLQSATEPEREPQFDSPRQFDYPWDPEVIANQWQSEASSQYALAWLIEWYDMILFVSCAYG